MISRLILSLNFQQRKIFHEVQDWAKKKIKARNSNKSFCRSPKAVHYRRGRCWKISFNEDYIMLLSKTFNLYSRSPDKPKVPILAPTRVAAIYINGTTINSGLSIPRLSDSERRRLRNLYSGIGCING